jgi:hypothetical protein
MPVAASRDFARSTGATGGRVMTQYLLLSATFYFLASAPCDFWPQGQKSG